MKSNSIHPHPCNVSTENVEPCISLGRRHYLQLLGSSALLSACGGGSGPTNGVQSSATTIEQPMLLGGLQLDMTSDMDLIKSRVLNDLINTNLPSASTVQGYLDTLSVSPTDGLLEWPDINYTQQSDIIDPTWPTLNHVMRILGMAQAWANNNAANLFYQSPNLAEKISQLLDTWAARNLLAKNWYFNVIALPKGLLKIILIFGNRNIRTNTYTILYQIINQHAFTASALAMSGANGFDITECLLYDAIEKFDTNKFNSIKDRLESEIDLTTVPAVEGIQQDYTFHAHNVQIQNGGYGSDFLKYIYFDKKYFFGTGFGLTDRALGILAMYIANSFAYMTRGTMIASSYMGRVGSRAGRASDNIVRYVASRVTELIAYSTRLGSLAPPLIAYKNRTDYSLANGKEKETLVQDFGFKYFWASDAAAYQIQNLAVFLKTVSTYSNEPDYDNNENILGKHLYNGTTFIARQGIEYGALNNDVYYPTANWYRLPGTTVAQDGHALMPLGGSYKGNAEFCGGVSLGSIGLSCQADTREKVSAKKAWIFSNEGMIALGSQINASTSQSDVVTTLNQCLLNGTVNYSVGNTASSITSEGISKLSSLQWIHHDSIGYYFLTSPAIVEVSNTSRTGSWSRINITGKTDVLQSKIFEAVINHGQAFTDKAYAYMVRGSSLADMNSAKMNDYVLESNSSTVQAVLQKSTHTRWAIFWASGATNQLSVNQPIAVIVKDQYGMAEIAVNAIDMNRTAKAKVQLTLSTAMSGVVTSHEAIVVQRTPQNNSIILLVDFSILPRSGVSIKLSLI